MARIVAVADVYDALLSERPYKDPWPMQKAVEYLSEQRGKHFDPDCVDAFLAQLDQISRIQQIFTDVPKQSSQ
jgi:response regulator RpfG family c-di-GMP phosphodiesterase